ncbi:hypothetical protein [Candidatus Uabimicrobium amorphum]|uniref:Uncharacterized protein n=1 Tax=Uabimicrobium amorphum TaxID=2596890 RepID=A0A5S9F3A6_UABAM|nr:hypothetical protein [Candidatus Uabimicrobium amorphum]BBM84545.1 hypothetical protein UABAM_02906 [Candidatus Uabimicrobium amorphum]
MEKKDIVVSNCCHLRCKMAYLPIPGETDWRTNQSSLSNYWCLRTMTPVGPDDYYVAPEVCQNRRKCYESEELT